jgi:hypothetical protein
MNGVQLIYDSDPDSGECLKLPPSIIDLPDGRSLLISGFSIDLESGAPVQFTLRGSFLRKSAEEPDTKTRPFSPPKEC